MFCQNCGKQVPSGTKFCQFCGSKLGYADIKEIQNPSNLSQQKTAIEKKHKGLIVAFIGVALIVIFCVVLSYMHSPEHQILGRWQVTTDDSPEYMEFFSDGTVLLEYDDTWEDEPPEQYDYEFTLLDQLVLSGGEDSTTVDFEITGDYLELYTDEDETISYRRVSK